jgi:ABC-2 type transport system ATP-binding protein
MDSTSAITVKNLRKSYKKVTVLRDVSLTVKRGSIFALLGANGAGKTTMINILTTLLRADGGTATVGGFDTVKQSEKVRGSVSLTGQFAAVDDILTARENLLLVGELRHVASPAKTAAELLEQFDLVDAADRRVATFSGGMRRRLDIALSLIGNPAIIFLDEPTTGLDPQSRNMMWAQIKDLAGNGTTVFLTTQYLDEADQLADTIAVLSDGKIVAKGSPQDLKKLLPHGKVELSFSDATQLALAAKALESFETQLNDETNSLAVMTDGTVAQLARLFHLLAAAKIEPAEFSQKTPTLDDAFLQIINANKEKK